MAQVRHKPTDDDELKEGGEKPKGERASRPVQGAGGRGGRVHIQLDGDEDGGGGDADGDGELDGGDF